MPSALIANAAASGDTTLVAGAAGKQIRVHSFVYQLSGTTAVKFKSGSTDLTGAMAGVNGNVVAQGFDPNGHFVTAAGDDLVLNSSQAIGVNGSIEYSVVG